MSTGRVILYKPVFSIVNQCGFVKSLLGLVASLLFCVHVLADVPGSSDAAMVDRYPLSEIVAYEQQMSPEYWLALGPMKKVNGLISPERSEALAGRLTRITYRVPDGHSSAEAYQYVVNQLQSADFDVAYECAGRRCGSSNQWANSQFAIALLYGVDREQYYGAFRKRDKMQTIAVYAVRRGNRRIYLHLDLLEGANAPKSGGEASLFATGSRVFVELGDSLDSLAEGLRGIFKNDPATRVKLVGHSVRGDDTEARRQSAQVDAERVRDRLIVLGVPSAMLEAHGIGDLAPAFDDSVPVNRVELLTQ